MQQPNEMMNPPPLPLNITTEQIQKYLEENKQLILAIMENQNQGRAAESAMYQTQLQNNLLYLAKIADNQPQASQSSQPSSKVPSQTPPQPLMQEEHYIQASHPAMSQQQQGFLALKSPFPLNDQQQQQQQHQLSYVQQQQLIQAQMGMRPGAPTGIYQAMQSGPGNSFAAIQGSRQDGSEGGASDGTGR
ncbi:hypothetical protein ACOSP7_031482 [Xanthoceras sorbifolium]